MAMKRILVPVDFSKESLLALEYAVELAKAFGSRLLVTFVIEPVYYATASNMYGANVGAGSLIEEQRRAGDEQLARLADELRKRGLRVQSSLEMGSAHDQIVRRAQRWKADLIVMGTHGRTGLSHLLLGSTAERVVRTATCPVLTVRRGSARAPRRSPARKRAKHVRRVV